MIRYWIVLVFVLLAGCYDQAPRSITYQYQGNKDIGCVYVGARTYRCTFVITLPQETPAIPRVDSSSLLWHHRQARPTNPF